MVQHRSFYSHAIPKFESYVCVVLLTLIFTLDLELIYHIHIHQCNKSTYSAHQYKYYVGMTWCTSMHCSIVSSIFGQCLLPWRHGLNANEVIRLWVNCRFASRRWEIPDGSGRSDTHKYSFHSDTTAERTRRNKFGRDRGVWPRRNVHTMLLCIITVTELRPKQALNFMSEKFSNNSLWMDK